MNEDREAARRRSLMAMAAISDWVKHEYVPDSSERDSRMGQKVTLSSWSKYSFVRLGIIDKCKHSDAGTLHRPAWSSVNQWIQNMRQVSM